MKENDGSFFLLTTGSEINQHRMKVFYYPAST